MRYAAVMALSALAVSASAQSLQFHGFVDAREVRAKAPEPWTTGGFGIFDIGGDRTRSVGVAQLGADWTPATWLLMHADGLARNDASAGRGKRAGLVQAYVDVFTERWRLRAGHFWLPASRENIDPLWNSRYTITFSALNTWIGQEFRPIGADLQFSPNFYVTLGATAFRGNDTMGTLLAARGWTLGNRLTVYNEVVPAGPDPTRPFGKDLDAKTGYAERLRFQMPERAVLQVTHVDNRATIGRPAPPEVPWLTRYDTVGTTIGTDAPTTFAAEWASGDTTVGFPHGTFRVGFNTAYALVSHKIRAERFSARIERFTTRLTRGHATTVAWLHDINAQTRFGTEFVRASANNGGSTMTVELRYGF